MELGNEFFGHSRGNIAVPSRPLYTQLITPLFDAMGCDNYGIHFDNDIFEMHPYCWCDTPECLQCGKRTQTTFLYKPTGFTLMWYKYAMRDAYTNVALTDDAFKAIIDACIASLPADFITERRSESLASRGVRSHAAAQAAMDRMTSNGVYGARLSSPTELLKGMTREQISAYISDDSVSKMYPRVIDAKLLKK
jgi:hypothetical protein